MFNDEKVTFEGESVSSFLGEMKAKDGREIQAEDVRNLSRIAKQKHAPKEKWFHPKEKHSSVIVYSSKGVKKVERENLERNQTEYITIVENSIDWDNISSATEIVAKVLESLCELLKENPDRIVTKSELKNYILDKIYSGQKTKNSTVYTAIKDLKKKGIITEFNHSPRQVQLLLTGKLFPGEQEWAKLRSDRNKSKSKKLKQKEEKGDTSDDKIDDVIEDLPEIEDVYDDDPGVPSLGPEISIQDIIKQVEGGGEKIKEIAKKREIHIGTININLININAK